MNEIINEKGKQVAQRTLAVRTRTWTLTLAILISLAFYIIVNVTTRQSINWIDFVLLTIMQILVHAMYFPDGDLFGQKDKTFINNKKAYNEKADAISEREEIGRLRAFCEWEFEERRVRYIQNQCGLIGITTNELEILKTKSETEIKSLTTWECQTIKDHTGNPCIVRFSKSKRKILYNLIFKPIPVEKNHPETIMSAVENNGNRAIRDTSIGYKVQSYIKKVLTAIVIGGIFAYIGYTLRDGFGFAQVVQICMYLTTLFSTAVMGFTSGETCSKVHKANFYKDLANFIDAFNEWNARKDG